MTVKDSWCVHKFPLPIEETFFVELPADAQVLSVGVQGGHAFLWALVDPEGRYLSRLFHLLGTGHPVGDRRLGRFVGTFQMDLPRGRFVGHLFEGVMT